MHASEGIIEFLVRKRVVRVRPRGVEERRGGCDLARHELVARRPPSRLSSHKNRYPASLLEAK